LKDIPPRAASDSICSEDFDAVNQDSCKTVRTFLILLTSALVAIFLPALRWQFSR
jgi:hypothetical protein